MSTAEKRASAKKPPLHISEEDYDRIAGLAVRVEHTAPALFELIMSELERAKVHPANSLPKNVVALGSEVEFIEDITGTRRRVQLVLPADADLEAGRISIMTPVGAGLIGMSSGREINWPCPDGRARTIKILEVIQQPKG